MTDPDAFRAFYEDALPRVYGYLLPRCGGHTPTAEGLTQETFLAAVADLRRGTAVAKPIPWVLGIARHKLVDWYRRRGREATPPEPRLARDPATSGFEHVADAHPALDPAPDEQGLTLGALAALPPDQRTALVLRHMDGLPVPDVAVALGRSVHATESLLARGRATFRRRYDALRCEEASRE